MVPINSKLLGKTNFVNFEHCATCGARLTGKKFINPNVGELVCSACKQNTYIEVDNAVMSVIKILKNADYDSLGSVKFNEIVIDKALSFLSSNYEWRFGSAINIYN